MKLYTEEQVSEMLSMTDMIMYGDSIPNNDILASFTPIELPSDEEMDKFLLDNSYEYGYVYKYAIDWIKNQILNQNK